MRETTLTKKVGFLSFAGGDPGWRLAAARIQKQSRRSGFFHCTQLYSPRTLKKLIPAQEYEFMKLNKRGFGFWLWKPIILLDFLNKHEALDYVVYLDSGCDINFNQASQDRFISYLEIMDNAKSICFEMELIEKYWTKYEVVNDLRASEIEMNTPQMLGGVFIMKREFAIEFCEKWLRTMRKSNYKLLDNSFDPQIQINGFTEPRHDQSIFSLLIKREKQVAILNSGDEVYFHPDWSQGKDYPFWTSRNKSLIPTVKTSQAWVVARLLERTMLKLYKYGLLIVKR